MVERTVRVYEDWRDERGFPPAGIVLADFRAIYIPIPKVANTSVKQALANVLELLGDVHGEVQWVWIENAEIRRVHSDWFVFSFVRNPWDRLLSCYFSKVHPDRMDDPILWHGVEPEFAKYGDAFHGQMSFDEFVRDGSDSR